VAATILMVLCLPVLAKDHSDEYKMGTLVLVPMHVENKQQTSYTDTTDCHDSPFGLQCSGGIVDNYDGWLVAEMPDGTKMAIQRCAGGATAAALFLPCDIPYVPVLTEEDGSIVFLHHPWGYHDSAKELAATSKVLYRVEHKPGVTYIRIPDPANPKKEGTYWIIKLPKQPEASKPHPLSQDNVAAVCSSGRLSAALQDKYCSVANKNDGKP